MPRHPGYTRLRLGQSQTLHEGHRCRHGPMKYVGRVYALATPRPSQSLFLHCPQTSSKPSSTFAQVRFASLSLSRRSQSPRSIYSCPSCVFSLSRFQSCSCSLLTLSRLAAFAVVCRDMCRVSLTFERCWMSSRLEWVRWESATSGSAEGWGSSSSVDCMIGRSSSISSGSGRMANGPEKDTAMEVRVRDWCVRCVVRASWAVFNLGVC